MKSLKPILLGTAIATASLGTAFAADPKVADIDVSVEFAANDANALEFYPTLEADLETKIAESLAPMMDDNGGRIEVIVKDLSVDGSAILNGEGEFNTLSGGLFFYAPNPDPSSEASNVTPATSTVNVVAVPEYPASTDAMGPSYVMAPSDGTVYDVMIDKFAEVVAERLGEM